ncbi:MAG: arsenate reductase [Arenicella sp.]|jgi:arsenate reductase
MPKRLLYICTHNRCRSIIAEAVTNKLAEGRIEAASAGSQESGEIHPLTLQFLREKDFSCDGLRSQSWDDFAHFEPNVILTMCDQAATETCPIWFGSTPSIHWGLPDPSRLLGDTDQVRSRFYTTIDDVRNRVEKLLKLDLDNASDQQWVQALRSLA